MMRFATLDWMSAKWGREIRESQDEREVYNNIDLWEIFIQVGIFTKSLIKAI